MNFWNRLFHPPETCVAPDVDHVAACTWHLNSDFMNLLVDVLDAFNKFGHFIILGKYMCGFYLCSRMRHGKINPTQWLKS